MSSLTHYPLIVFKSLEILKWLSESVNRRRTNNIMVKGKRTNNDLQNTTQKTKDRVTPTPLKTGGELMCSGRVSGANGRVLMKTFLEQFHK